MLGSGFGVWVGFRVVKEANAEGKSRSACETLNPKFSSLRIKHETQNMPKPYTPISWEAMLESLQG